MVLKMRENYISNKYLPPPQKHLYHFVPKAAEAEIKALYLGQKVFLDPGLQMGLLNKYTGYKGVR